MVERLNDFNVLGKNIIVVYCVYVDEKEKDLVVESNICVVYNLEFNMGNVVGVLFVIELINKGVIVGFGIDGYI